MALKVENKVEIHGNTYRTFSCDEFIQSPTNWYFEYITLNISTVMDHIRSFYKAINNKN
jgi:hypothetical protein